MIKQKMIRRLEKLEDVVAETTLTKIWRLAAVHKNEHGELVRETISESVWTCKVGRDGRHTGLRRVDPQPSAIPPQ